MKFGFLFYVMYFTFCKKLSVQSLLTGPRMAERVCKGQIVKKMSNFKNTAGLWRSFTDFDVNFDVTFEGHQNWSNKHNLNF